MVPRSKLVLTEQASSEKGSRGRLGQPSQSRVPQSSRRAAAGPGGRYAPRRMSSGRALAVLPTLRLQNSPPAQPADVEPGNAAAHTPSSLARCRGPTPVTQPWGGTTEAPPSTASDWLSRCHHVAGKLTVCACVRVCVCQGVCVCVCVCVYACGVCFVIRAPVSRSRGRPGRTLRRPQTGPQRCSWDTPLHNDAAD
jgi:hypothetical protein